MVPTSTAGAPPRNGSKSASHVESSTSKKVNGSKTNDNSSDDGNGSDGSSSSSSGEDDDDDEGESGSGSEGDNESEIPDAKQLALSPRKPLAPLPAAATGPIDSNSPLGILRSMIELAQACHFLHLFGPTLKIPTISRLELESGIIDGSKSDAFPLVVEVFYRLCRDAGQKIEKSRMLQEWERVVHRKLTENWKREFLENPMPGSFDDVSVRDRARILHALCEWRIHASDISKFISGIPPTAPKEDKKTAAPAAITYDSLRPEPLGEDDNGSIYWYFHDGCWVYAEDGPASSSQRTANRPVYHVRYSTPSKIRLSTHFELENNAGLDTLVDATLPSSSSLKRKRSSSSKKESKKSKRSSHHRSRRSSDKRREDDDDDDEDEESDVKPPKKTVKAEKTEVPEKPPLPLSPPPKPVPKVETVAVDDEKSVKTEETAGPDEQDTHVLCSMCKKSYDMSLLDPPLLKKPQGEWKCFECLVNDCRGWPRRRPSRQVAPPPPPPPAPDKKSSKKKSSSSSSSKKKSSSSSKSSSKKSSKSHHSSSSKKKSSRKHRSSHSYPDEYKHLLDLYHTRKRQRDVALASSLADGMPPPPWLEPRQSDSHHTLNGDAPATGWRVVSASVADLKELLATRFSGAGSMAHQRLKGRLIQILKAGEAMEEEAARLRLQEEQQLMWQMQALPRRASSRVALERLKSQNDPHFAKSDDEAPWEEKLHPSTAHDRAQRLSRRTSATDSAAEGDDRQKRRLAMERAHRASRRQREWDGASSDEDQVVTPRQTRQAAVNHTPVKGGDFVNWKTVQTHEHPLRSVCAALVTRMIQEEKAPLFSRPVDPVADGCPDYLAIVKHPMDLGTVKLRSLNGHYKTWAMFKVDMGRIWANCRLYNSEGAVIVEYANELENIYLGLVRQAEGNGATSLQERGAAKSLSDDDDDEFHKSSDSSHDGSSSSGTNSSADDNSSSSSSHSSSSDEGKRPSKHRPRHGRSSSVKANARPPTPAAPKPTPPAPSRLKKPQRKQRISSSSSSESEVAASARRKKAPPTTTPATAAPKQALPSRNPPPRHPKTIVESSSSSSSSGSSSSSSEDDSPSKPPPPPPAAKKKPQTPPPPPPPSTPPPPVPSGGADDGHSSSSSYFSSSDDSD